MNHRFYQRSGFWAAVAATVNVIAAAFVPEMDVGTAVSAACATWAMFFGFATRNPSQKGAK